jgi:Cu(I)/Ag(I) efflux system membrane protein CusA/SilA
MAARHDAGQAGGRTGPHRQVPGLANIWVPPIRNRIDMLATGIKSPVGVKVAGTDLATIDRLTGEIEKALKDVPGVSSALAERLTGGRYVDVNINRDAAARFGMNIADVQSVITSAVGGDNIGETVEGLQRFPINMRYPVRSAIRWKSCALPIVTERGQRLVLSDVADIRITDGPPMLRSENARLSGWVYVDIRGRDLRSAVQDMQKAVAEKVALPAGLLGVLVRAVRVSGARHGQAQGGGAVHAAHHLCAAVPDVQAV